LRRKRDNGEGSIYRRKDGHYGLIEANAQKLFPNVRAAYEGMELKI